MAEIKKIEYRCGKQLELIFKVAYLSLALATFNSFLYVSALQPALVKVVLLLGVLFLLVRMFNWKKYIKMPGIVLAFLFCISFLFSAFMNRQYELTGNLKWVIWTGLLFFALYVCDVEREQKAYRREFRVLSHILIVYTTVSAITGIGMLVTSYSNILITDTGETATAGLNWGRLWGVYTDPNYGAVLSVAAILLAMLFFMQKKGWIRLLYVCGILANYLYIVFSDSRTGKIALACSLGCYLFLWMIQKEKESAAGKRFGTAILVVVCAVTLALGGGYVIKKEYNRVLAPVFREMFPQKQVKPVVPQKPAETIGRKADIEKDVSNGRLALWESAVEIWKTSPVYGTGYTSLIPYCKENVPDTYVINNSQTEYTSMHNAFLNTLVFQGSIGLILLFAMAGRIISYIIPSIWKTEGEDYLNLAAMLSCVGAVVVSMLFLLEGTYTNSPGSFVLWVFSGYMVQTVYRRKHTE